MKPKLTPNGILRLSTMALMASLSACGSSESSISDLRQSPEQQDSGPVSIDEQKLLADVESKRELFSSGKIENNYFHKGLGYYHADAHRFFDKPYQFSENGKWFENGEWKDMKGPEVVDPSEPDTATLAALERNLEEINQSMASTNNNSGSTVHHHHHNSGSGLATGMLAYWILAGNNHRYTPSNPGMMNRYGSNMEQNFQQSRARANSTVTSAPRTQPQAQPSDANNGTKRGLFGTSTRSSSSS